MATRCELQERRARLQRDDPELVKLGREWHDASIICHRMACEFSTDNHAAPPTPEEAAQELATRGCVKLPGAYKKEEIARIVENLSKREDPFALFYHDPKTQCHIGMAELEAVDHEQLGWDVQPVLDAIAPRLGLTTEMGWFIMAQPHAPREAPHRWHVDGFEDKVWHSSVRTMVSLWYTPATERNGATAVLEGSHLWLARYLKKQTRPVGASGLLRKFRTDRTLHEECPLRFSLAIRGTSG